ncbi:MAG: hypothetical protein D6770_05290 [Anaerolineae bacterium]|nr:MAG: hypothetical protein D6770_05290 [Anaerolineae bacterium]
MYDLIVIGGGPAGLTAMVYAIRKRLDALLLTKDLGGKTNYRLALPWVQDYQIIRGLETVNKFRAELEYLDFARRMEAAEKVRRIDNGFAVTTRSGDEFQARAIIVATGARQVRMGVPGEKEFTMKGLCYSALSYAPLCIDRVTIVIGDEDLAVRSASELATVARRVYLVCESGQALSSPLGRKLQQAENVTILQGYQVTEVKGDAYARSLVLRTPTGETKEIEADAMFVEKALTPRSELVADLVRLDERGRIIVDCANRTNVPGIFAAGDVTNIYAEQVLIAVGEGAKAALSAYDYILSIS